jgi:hypothetical protein
MTKCAAEKYRFSPDMKTRWLPTVNGKVIVGRGEIPFDGFSTRREAVAAAWRRAKEIEEQEFGAMTPRTAAITRS